MKFTRCDITTCGAEIPEGKEHQCCFIDRVYDLCDKCFGVVQEWVKQMLVERPVPPPTPSTWTYQPIQLTPYIPPNGSGTGGPVPNGTIIFSNTADGKEPFGIYTTTPVDQNGTPGLPYKDEWTVSPDGALAWKNSSILEAKKKHFEATGIPISGMMPTMEDFKLVIDDEETKNV